MNRFHTFSPRDHLSDEGFPVKIVHIAFKEQKTLEKAELDAIF